MRVLFILPLMNQVRHFDRVIRTLAKRGHTVEIATPGRKNEWPLPDKLAENPRVVHTICPGTRQDKWKHAATDFRLMVDAAHYLERPFFPAAKLRERAFREFASVVSAGERNHLAAQCPECKATILDGDLTAMVPSLGPTGAARLSELARLIEQSIPADPAREAFLRSRRPDVVLVTPLVLLGSDQPEWVKAAKALGIPVGFPVFSWDNLTTKGIIHVQPDRVFVWNEVQKREAVEYYDVPEERVVVTGAPRFDTFFTLKPSMDRAAFYDAHGLDPSSPTVTYVCSSDFVAGREVEFVRSWIQQIRRAPTLASCNVIVRAHPRSVQQWSGVDVQSWGRVGLSISRRLNADRILFDTLYYSDAVVGLNTSAQIEAGILGKPVLTLLAPGFEQGQQGTLHFKYLLREADGFVDLASNFDDHRRQLADAVAGRYDREQIRRAVERFIRPAGWDQPAAPYLADAILQLAPARPSPVKRWFGANR